MSSRVYLMPIAMLIIAGILLISSNQVLADISENCQTNMLVVGLECEDYVLRPEPEVSPSPECCVALKKVDVPCLCNFVIDPVEINLVSVAQFCGKQFSPGSRCGNYKIPSA